MTEFEEFFATTWREYLNSLDTYQSGVVFSDGKSINEASWDRKAAFLLWMIINDLPPPE